MVDTAAEASDYSSPLPNPDSHHLFGIDFHVVRMADAVEWVMARLQAADRQCQLVFTPNVDHVVKLRDDLAFRQAYERADLVIADGWPIVSASRMLHKTLPARVPGSELVPTVIASGTTDFRPRVFLLGGAAGVGERATQRLLAAHPHLEIVGTDSPPMGFEKSEQESDRIVEKVNQAEPDLLVVGFGAPKQELWLAAHRDRLRAKVAIAAGATIDFMAGEQTRAPGWIQAMRLEWLHRIATNPRRLIGRYAKDAIVFPQLVLKEMWTKK
ncbi:Putative N-acetylmannosaminyltransferase [Aeoliella mucimassa]|uniref:N-acetylmannosaminyltransferase n=2 Tax=Aeoliella mucimassa TaxID=2527972 RepID=A0A518AJZ0_9BACT|nr:Putative N-acetylmannosaminyltransferase [Aeoliella mucimassa]